MVIGVNSSSSSADGIDHKQLVHCDLKPSPRPMQKKMLAQSLISAPFCMSSQDDDRLKSGLGLGCLQTLEEAEIRFCDLSCCDER